MQHEDLEKRLYSLHTERRILYRQQRELGWAELYPPVMRGWKRTYVLRNDISRSKYGPFFEGILIKINTIEYSSRKDFKIKKRKARKKIYVVKEQQLLHPDEYLFVKLKFTEQESSYFEVRYFKNKWRKDMDRKFVFTEPWRFVLRVRPNIISKVRIHNVEIEKRIAEINDYIGRNGLGGKLSRKVNGYYRWRNDKEENPDEKDPFKNKSLTSILDLVKCCHY
jgi:hypothetical protein